MALARASLLTAISSLAVLAAMPVQAEDAKAPAATDNATPSTDESGEDIANEIIVTANNVRGQVDTPVPPVQELNEADIASYGAGSITDLIAALAPSTSSGSGRSAGGMPAILINGMRVSSFREMASYPPESIKKVEVLPESVAQKYGFSADQRIINIILKDNFSSKTVEAQYGQPWAGGTSNWDLEGTYLMIAGPSRINIHGEFKDTSPLTEAERGIIQSTPPPAAGALDPADYRTLVASSNSEELVGNLTTKLSDAGAALSVNGTYDRSKSLSLNGLNTLLLTDPIESRSLTDTVSLGSTLNLPLGDWQVTGTLDASHANSRSVIDHSYDADYDTAKTINDSATSKITAMGSPFAMPAGDVSLTLNSGYSWNRIQSDDSRSAMGETSLTRGDLTAGVNVGVPISERGGTLGAIGDLNLNLTAGVDHLSDFGTLTNWSTGFSWGWTDNLSFQGSYLARDAAPTLTQLNSPETITPNVQTYDLTRGETVLVNVISGGNPDLTKQKQRDYRFGTQWRLPFLQGSNVSIDYFHNHSENVSASFPLLTPAIEAAFPGRVVRDGSGRLVSIDQRPVTFAEENSSRLRFGLNLTGAFGKALPPGAAGGGGFGLFGAIRSAQGGGQGAAPGGAAPKASAPLNGGQGPVGTPAPGAPQGGAGQGGAGQGGGWGARGPGGPGGAFDPQKFQEFRTKLCAEGAETPDISTLPEPMQERMKGTDGKLDPAKFAEFKQRICSADGAPGGGFFNPEQFQQFREKLCASGDMPDLSTLPPQFLDRLKGPDGQIDPARLKEFKERICAMPAPAAGNGQGERRGAGQGAGQGGEGAPPPGGPEAGGAPPPIAAGGGGPGGPGGGGRGPGGGRGFGGPGGGDGRGRWFLSLNYTLELENQVLIAEGLPVLDQLDGDGLSGGGVVRHSAQLQGGLFYRGLGLRYSANYSGSSDINGSGLPGSTDLHFGTLATLDLRLFADLGQQAKLVEKVPFLKGARVSFGVTNIFGSIRKITDENGDVPIRYQPGLVDPEGRALEIEFRKMF